MLREPKLPLTKSFLSSMTEANGESIVLEGGSLQDWTWSYGQGDIKSFLYRNGEYREVTLSNRNTKSEMVGVKASGGWGSSFIAEQSKSYALKFQVMTPTKTKRPARLLLQGHYL